MKIVETVQDAVNARVLAPGSRIYASGLASTPRMIFRQMAADTAIRDVDLMGVLYLGEVSELFAEEPCQRVTHRVIFASQPSREALNKGWAKYQLMHLGDIPMQVRGYYKPDVVVLTVAGPDKGGNYSMGTTIEGTLAAIQTAKANNGIVIAERNARMPFILGTTIPGAWIDYLVDTDYPLPASPAPLQDEASRRIGRMIAGRVIMTGARSNTASARSRRPSQTPYWKRGSKPGHPYRTVRRRHAAAGARWGGFQLLHQPRRPVQHGDALSCRRSGGI